VEEEIMTRTDNTAVSAEQLVVYGADWCPDVRRTRRLLDQSDVPYRYVDIDDDAQARETVRRLQHGGRRIPTLLWADGSHLVEPGDDELRAHLAAREC
jgi:mycoredoxin